MAQLTYYLDNDQYNDGLVLNISLLQSRITRVRNVLSRNSYAVYRFIMICWVPVISEIIPEKLQPDPFLYVAYADTYVCLHHLQWELANNDWFLNLGTISEFGRAGIPIPSPCLLYTSPSPRD